jgi:hypothetical protein
VHPCSTGTNRTCNLQSKHGNLTKVLKCKTRNENKLIYYKIADLNERSEAWFSTKKDYRGIYAAQIKF